MTSHSLDVSPRLSLLYCYKYGVSVPQVLKAGAGWLRVFEMGGLLVLWFEVTCYKHFLWGRGGGVVGNPFFSKKHW